ncbi:hypothetical protein NE865_00156 [Phthorimaea operculella]|nr:hypothetical protein NE865_00156 [Phthorimaea operculella]
MWWKGPIFLQNREYSFDDQSVQLPDDLPELQAASASSKGVVLLTTKEVEFFKHFDKYSDINKMTRVMAYIMRFCHNCRPQNTKNKQNFLSSAELQHALKLIIKHEQEIHFEEEIRSLVKNENIKGPLKPLHVFRDKMGLVRVGGRLQNSDLSFDQKHPIILPKASRITELIIHREHLRLLHAGPRLILSQLNQKY